MKRYLAMDPGSREAGFALVEDAPPNQLPKLIKTWRASAHSDNRGRQFRKLAQDCSTAVGQAAKLGATHFIIEKPPRMFGNQGGRGQIQDNFFILGIPAGFALRDWFSRGGDPFDFVQVADWRNALKNLHGKYGKEDDWKAAAVRTVELNFHETHPPDVAEAVLIGVACCIKPDIWMPHPPKPRKPRLQPQP